TNCSLYASMFEKFGIHFKYTHVINQYWKFHENLKSKLKKQATEFKKNRAWDEDILHTSEQISQQQKSLREEGNILCNHSFNIFILEYPIFFERAVELVKELIRSNDCYFEKPSREGLY